jgi:hypothetical protein
MLIPASASAMTAISAASRMTTLSDSPFTIALTTRPASTGVATARAAVTTLSRRNDASCQRRTLANAAIRRSVTLETGR